MASSREEFSDIKAKIINLLETSAYRSRSDASMPFNTHSSEFINKAKIIFKDLTFYKYVDNTDSDRIRAFPKLDFDKIFKFRECLSEHVDNYHKSLEMTHMLISFENVKKALDDEIAKEAEHNSLIALRHATIIYNERCLKAKSDPVIQDKASALAYAYKILTSDEPCTTEELLGDVRSKFSNAFKATKFGLWKSEEASKVYQLISKSAESASKLRESKDDLKENMMPLRKIQRHNRRQSF